MSVIDHSHARVKTVESADGTSIVPRAEIFAQTGLQLSRIGTCLRGAGGRRGGVRLLDHSKPVTLPAGYDHFA